MSNHPNTRWFRGIESQSMKEAPRPLPQAPIQALISRLSDTPVDTVVPAALINCTILRSSADAIKYGWPPKKRLSFGRLGGWLHPRAANSRFCRVATPGYVATRGPDVCGKAPGSRSVPTRSARIEFGQRKSVNVDSHHPLRPALATPLRRSDTVATPQHYRNHLTELASLIWRRS